MATLYTRKLKNGISYTLGWYEGKQRHRKALGFITKKEAEVLKLRKELELRGEATAVTRKHAMFKTFVESDYLPIYSAHYPATYERTAGIIHNYLMPFFGTMSLADITDHDVNRYQLERLNNDNLKCKSNAKNRRSAPSTINLEVKALMAILRKALKWKIINKMEVENVEYFKNNKSRIKYFKPDELQQIYKAAQNPHYWKFLVNTGLRLGEALRLQWEHIESDFILVESTNIAPTKSKQSRIVSLFSGAREALDVFEKTRKTEFVFPQLGKSYFSEIAKKEIARANLTGYCHMFRHTFGTMLAQKGLDLVSIQKLMGHSNLETTQQYLHVDMDSIINRVNLNL